KPSSSPTECSSRSSLKTLSRYAGRGQREGLAAFPQPPSFIRQIREAETNPSVLLAETPAVENVVSKMIERGLVSPVTAERVRTLLAEGKSLEDAVLAADGVSEEALLRFLAASFDIPYVDLEKIPPAKEILAAFPARLLVRHRILPLEERDGVTIVVASRVSDTGALDELRLVCGKDLGLALAPSAEIDRALKRLLGVGADTLQ